MKAMAQFLEGLCWGLGFWVAYRILDALIGLIK